MLSFNFSSAHKTSGAVPLAAPTLATKIANLGGTRRQIGRISRAAPLFDRGALAAGYMTDALIRGVLVNKEKIRAFSNKCELRRAPQSARLRAKKTFFPA